jgi:hypothetical protein
MSPATIESSLLTTSLSYCLDVVHAGWHSVLGTIRRHGSSGGFKIVGPGHAGFLCVVDIGSGVQTSSLGILFGVVNALNLGVPLVTSGGGDVHELMEHGHSQHSFISCFQLEGPRTESDVRLGKSAGFRSLRHHVSDDALSTTYTAGSNVPFAAHQGPLSGISEHRIHGSLEPDLHVLIVVSSSLSKPLCEESLVLIPAFIGRSDDGFRLIGLV